MAKHLSAHDKRRARIRKKISGTTERPRLTVYKSLKHMYAQIVDDTTGKTLVAASTGSKTLKNDVKEDGKTDAAKKVGAALAKAALEKGVKRVVFDRNGFDYHGRVAAVSTGSKALKNEVKEDGKTDAAKKVGAAIAKAALEKGVTQVVFDRNGFDYHGRVAAVAQAAREAGLQF